MQSFEYCNFISLVYQISCACQSCRTCADDGDLVAVCIYRLDLLIAVMCSMPVSSESFQSSDCNRFALCTAYAYALALVFLRTNSSADCRK